MIVKGKIVLWCDSCGGEIKGLSYEKDIDLLTKQLYHQSVSFNPSKCPHCGEFIEGAEINTSIGGI